MKKFNKKQSLLAIDLCTIENITNDWKIEREKKSSIFNSYGEYIDFLEQRLEKDVSKKYFIEREIKKLKMEQKKYYVPSALEMARFDFGSSRKNLGNLLEKADFSPVKKVKIKSKKSS